jgi:hypothetical protein
MSEEATLQVPVFVEPLVNRPGYVAHLETPFHLSVEAGTPEEALKELAHAVRNRLRAGASVMPLTLPLHPTEPTAAGWLPDDELTKEWKGAVEDYRRECDEADRLRILGASAEDKDGL